MNTFSALLLKASLLLVAARINSALSEVNLVEITKLRDSKKLSNRQNDYGASSDENVEVWPESGNDNDYPDSSQETSQEQQYGDVGSSSNLPYENGASTSISKATKAQLARQQVLLNVDFYNDADQVDPHKPTAQWEWVGSESNTGYLADRASFVKRPARDYKNNAHLDLISVPFGQYVDPASNASGLSFFEGAIAPRNMTYMPSSSQKLMVRLLFGCETINADQFPFSAALSKNPWDDPR